MARYAESARAHYDSNPEAEHAHHERDIDALKLHEGTKQHIVDNGMAEVVAHLHANSSERMALAAMATPDRQIPAIQKIRKRIAGGDSGEEHDNEKVDDFLRSRGKLPTHHRRTGLAR
jgi:hypothetical protein